MLGHHGAPVHLVHDARAQGVCGFQFAVHHIHLLGAVRHGTQPAQDLVGIGVCGRGFQLHNLGLDRYVASVDTHRARTAGQGGTAGAGGLVAGQDDHVAVLARVLGQVVQRVEKDAKRIIVDWGVDY